MRDEHFKKYRPMIPQDKAWQIKKADQPAQLVGPPQPTSQTALTNRSDRSSPVQASSRIGITRFGFFC